MQRNPRFAIWLSTALCSIVGIAAVHAQIRQPVTNAEDDAIAAGISPVAYVYVAHTPKNSSTSEIAAYAAAPNGRLTPVEGSPFPEDVSSMAVNGLYLLAASNETPTINAYAIQSNGALTYSAYTDYAQYNDGSTVECGIAGQIFFDHTGSNLYVQEFEGTNACANTLIASFTVNKSTGGLNYLGIANTGAFPGNNSAAYFIGNNLYAYAADDSACMYYQIYGFARAGSGVLTGFDPTLTGMPAPPEGATAYLPALAAADPTNHVAFTLQPASPPGCAPGPLQLASFTADASGNLSTTGTAADMPSTSIVSASDMKMAPLGKLLALAGQEGLQIFHFNGAKPITPYTRLLTTDPIQQMFWDNNHHLYAISSTAGKLHVYTITADEYKEAPGSPYKIASPNDIIVQPWPLPWN